MLAAGGEDRRRGKVAGKACKVAALAAYPLFSGAVALVSGVRRAFLVLQHYMLDENNEKTGRADGTGAHINAPEVPDGRERMPPVHRLFLRQR